MIKGKTVYLRLMEPADCERTFLFRQAEDYQRMVAAPMRVSSMEMERAWAQKVSADNQRNIYFAICLVEDDRMVGWYSINDIDHRNRRCHCGGVVIGDRACRDGMAYTEAGDLAFRHIINELNMNRITGSCLREHAMSRAVMEAGLWTLEGIERQAIYKGGSYHDICHYAILRDEYLAHLAAGDYAPELKQRRLGAALLRLRREIKQNENINQ